MDFHPKDLPILKTYIVPDEKNAQDAINDIVKCGFKDKKGGFKVLMPKETKIAKRIGYTITTGITHGLRQKEVRDIKYWTYHHDDTYYAIVLIGSETLEKLGF